MGSPRRAPEVHPSPTEERRSGEQSRLRLGLAFLAFLAACAGVAAYRAIGAN